MHRSHLASIRVRRFQAAARDYVERAEFHPEPWARARAKALATTTMQMLATREAFGLIHQFSCFFTMVRLAGFDPLAFALSQPLTSKEARRALAPLIPSDWLQNGNELVARGHTNYKLVIGVLPKLACFGTILLEVEPDLVVKFAKQPCDDFESFSESLNQSISSALSRKTDDDDLSNHHYRTMLEITRQFEKGLGSDFSVLSLSDEVVLSSWQSMATGDRYVTRFAEFLRLVSAFTAEVRAVMNEQSSANTLELDNPDMHLSPSSEDILDDSNASAFDSSFADPVVAELLTDRDTQMAQFLLLKTIDLVGIYLSRARALAFSATENKLIEAKRRKSESRQLLPSRLNESKYDELFEEGQKLDERLRQLIRSAIKLAWDAGRPLDALDIAVSSNLTSVSEFALEDALSGARASGLRPEDVSSLVSALSSNSDWQMQLKLGGEAWKRLRRRLFFANLVSDQDGLETLLQGARVASNMQKKLEKITNHMRHAVELQLRGTGFQAEWDIIRLALNKVHAQPREDDAK
ncbi:MAG: hypothetical protein AAF996_04740 [Pseudomonadota bacterium]